MYPQSPRPSRILGRKLKTLGVYSSLFLGWEDPAPCDQGNYDVDRDKNNTHRIGNHYNPLLGFISACFGVTRKEG